MRPLASRDVLGAPLRRLQALAGGACVVLVYHRIAERAIDPHLQCVPVERFDEHMATLSADFSPISGQELAAHLLGHRKLPSRAVVVTFDDGYADNVTAALPVLQRHRVPATVFVSSGFLGGQHRMWVDELDELVLGAAELPEQLVVPGATFELPSGSYGPVEAAWDITKPAGDARTRTYLALAQLLKTADALGRESILAALREQIDPAESLDAPGTAMSVEQLRALAEDPLVTVGSHTVHHLRLASLAQHVQHAEVVCDKEALEGVLGKPVELYSYPYGGRQDIGEEAVAIVRDAGFKAGFATHYGAATPWTDRLRVPRISVSGSSAEELTQTIEAVFASGK